METSDELSRRELLQLGDGTLSVRSALASARGLVDDYGGGSNVPRRYRVRDNQQRPGSDIRHNGNAWYQRYQQDTNAPNDDQLVLASDSEC